MRVALVAAAHLAIVGLITCVNVGVLFAVRTVGETPITTFEFALERFLAYRSSSAAACFARIQLDWTRFCPSEAHGGDLYREVSLVVRKVPPVRERILSLPFFLSPPVLARAPPLWPVCGDREQRSENNNFMSLLMKTSCFVRPARKSAELARLHMNERRSAINHDYAAPRGASEIKSATCCGAREQLQDYYSNFARLCSLSLSFARWPLGRTWPGSSGGGG